MLTLSWNCMYNMSHQVTIQNVWEFATLKITSENYTFRSSRLKAIHWELLAHFCLRSVDMKDITRGKTHTHRWKVLVQSRCVVSGRHSVRPHRHRPPYRIYRAYLGAAKIKILRHKNWPATSGRFLLKKHPFYAFVFWSRTRKSGSFCGSNAIYSFYQVIQYYHVFAVHVPREVLFWSKISE